MSEPIGVADPPVGPCPSWCELGEGHDWEDLWANGLVRKHFWHRHVAPYHAIAVEEWEQWTSEGRVRMRSVLLDVESPTSWDVETAVRGAAILAEAILLVQTDVVEAGEVA